MTTHRAPADPVGADLTRLLKALKLGALADTLPERAALARQHKLSHIGFLETLLADEVSRRESRSAALRATKAGLDPTMRFDTWTAQDDLRYDRTLLGDLTSLRFLDAGQSAIILGPVGVGKTHLATALGHMAIRRRHTVQFARSDKLFTRLRAARLDNTVDAEIRRLATIDVLIIDDFALRPLGATETSDFYEIIVERHRAKTTIVTSNREPAEWLTMTADTLLAQSAIDRLTATAHTLVIEGPSYRQRTRASLTQTKATSILNNAPRWSHPPGNQVVPSPWQATLLTVAVGNPLLGWATGSLPVSFRCCRWQQPRSTQEVESCSHSLSGFPRVPGTGR